MAALREQRVLDPAWDDRGLYRLDSEGRKIINRKYHPAAGPPKSAHLTTARPSVDRRDCVAICRNCERLVERPDTLSVSWVHVADGQRSCRT